MKKDISKFVTFAILDVKTRKLNREIDKIRKSGKRIKVTITGYVQENDWSGWDGVSIEQGIDVTQCNVKAERRAKK